MEECCLGLFDQRQSELQDEDGEHCAVVGGCDINGIVGPSELLQIVSTSDASQKTKNGTISSCRTKHVAC